MICVGGYVRVVVSPGGGFRFVLRHEISNDRRRRQLFDRSPTHRMFARPLPPLIFDILSKQSCTPSQEIRENRNSHRRWRATRPTRRATNCVSVAVTFVWEATRTVSHMWDVETGGSGVKRTWCPVFYYILLRITVQSPLNSSFYLARLSRY